MKKTIIGAALIASLSLTGCATNLESQPSYETGVNWANSLVAASGAEAAKATMVQLYGSVQKACAAVVTVQVPKIASGVPTDAWVAGCSSVFK